jgi:hypothetical protein
MAPRVISLANSPARWAAHGSTCDQLGELTPACWQAPTVATCTKSQHGRVIRPDVHRGPPRMLSRTGQRPAACLCSERKHLQHAAAQLHWQLQGGKQGELLLLSTVTSAASWVQTRHPARWLRAGLVRPFPAHPNIEVSVPGSSAGPKYDALGRFRRRPATCHMELRPVHWGLAHHDVQHLPPVQLVYNRLPLHDL